MISVIIILLATVEVHALGISPSKKIIDYDTEEHIITSSIINNEARDIAIKISASGSLSKYVIISEPVLMIRSDESEKEFTYIVQLPENVDPGPKTIYITASEFNSAVGENSVGGLLSLTQQLQINIPYTGLYAESYLLVDATTINTPVNTMIEINNMGDQTIQSISGTLNINDASNRTVFTKKINEYDEYGNNIQIYPKSSFKIEESFNLKEAGSYTAQYDIVYNNTDYGNKSLVLKKDFDVGDYNITVLGADVKNFKLGTIAKFNIDLTAKWNRPINDVYGTITIKDKNNATVGQANITKTVINPNANSLTAYLDTANIKSGEYLIGIKLYAGNKIITQDYPSIIKEDKIDIGIAKETATTKNSHTLAIVLAISVIFITIALLLLIKNKKLYK